MLNFNRLRPQVGLLCALLMVFPPALEARTRKGDKYHKEARKAEAQKLYTQALELYELALREDPTDTSYQLSTRRVRFQAAQTHVQLGQKLRETGQLEDAVKEFQKAYAIDPSSVIAEQELRRTNEMIERKKGQPEAKGPVLTPAQEVRKAAEERMAGAMSLPELKPISRQIHSLK
jgi:general secretion pathway protein D